MKVKVGLNFDNLKALDDFENFDMFESFYKDGVKIFNKSMKLDMNQIKVFENNHRFFEALRQIQKLFSVTFNFPHKIKNDDVYFTKLLFESFVNKRMVGINNKGQVSMTFDKEKFESYEHSKLEQAVEIGVIRPREIAPLELFGAKLTFLEYTIYPKMRLQKIINDNQEDVEIIFDLPEKSKHYILFSLDSIDNFDMSTNSQKLFDLTNNAIAIENINLSIARK